MKYAFKALLLTVALLGGLSLRAWNAADYKEGAEAGDAVAQYNLGVCYERGYGVDKDLSEALKWYSRSAEGDYQNAQYRAALFKYNAWGTAKDLEGAAALARKAAAAGHPGASALFGVMLWKGEGVERNLDEAAKCLSFASGKGNAEAQFNYFKLLDEGVVEPKSPGDAMNALEKSAAQSFAPAQFELAMRLLAGEDAAKNVRRARELLIAPGKNGIQKAEAVLNELFPEIKPDAKVSDADLILSVSEAFKKGFGGVAPDEAKSKDLLQAAAKKGSPEAKLRVGVAAFDAGDFENAANLLKEAAWKLPEAQYRYGLMLNEGKGVQADPPKAIDYFRRAAQAASRRPP
jgi:TPR repeat protein